MLSHILSNTTCSWLDFTCFLCYVNHMLLGSTLESTTQKCAILAVTPWPIISGSSWITMNCMCNEIQTTGVLKNCQILGWSWVILWKNNQNPQDRLRWWVHTLHLPKTHPTSISYKLPLCNKGNLRGGGGCLVCFLQRQWYEMNFPNIVGWHSNQLTSFGDWKIPIWTFSVLKTNMGTQRIKKNPWMRRTGQSEQQVWVTLFDWTWYSIGKCTTQNSPIQSSICMVQQVSTWMLLGNHDLCRTTAPPMEWYISCLLKICLSATPEMNIPYKLWIVKTPEPYPNNFILRITSDAPLAIFY